MAPYFDHMHKKSTHERRQHAMRVAGVITALVFAGWVSTIGLRSSFSAGDAAVAGTPTSSGQSAAAALQGLSAQSGGNQLVVATSTN